MKKSIVTANYVTRAFGYAPPQPFDWGQCERKTEEAFTSPGWQERWAEICRETADLGVQAIEVWRAHLPPHRVDQKHIDEFTRIAHDHGLAVSAYAGWFGGPENDRGAFERDCNAARSIGAPFFQGGMNWGRLDVALPVLKDYGVRVTIENHPGMETADQILRQIAADPETIGAGPDTGWFAIVGENPTEAIRKLGQHIWHVHFKDMAPGGGHESCAPGYGTVGLEEVLAALREIGYGGYLSLEHEPAQGDPQPDIRRGLEWLRQRDPD